MATTTSTPSKARKFIELAGGHCGMLPADESMGISEIWLTCKDPARWVGVGRQLKTDECRALVATGELQKVRDDALTGAVIYRLQEVQS